jgi:hypothetical protein
VLQFLIPKNICTVFCEIFIKVCIFVFKKNLFIKGRGTQGSPWAYFCAFRATEILKIFSHKENNGNKGRASTLTQ